MGASLADGSGAVSVLGKNRILYAINFAYYS